MHRRQRATVMATFFSQGAMFASWAAHIPEVKTHIGLSDGLLGTILLAPPVGAAVAMLLTGRLLAGLGSRRIIRPSMLGYCLSALSVGETGAPATLALALLAQTLETRGGGGAGRPGFRTPCCSSARSRS